MNKKNIAKISVLIVIVVTLVALYLFTPLREFLTEEGIRSFIEQFGSFAPLAYGILYFLAVLFFLPASVFTVLAGILFGKFWGTIIVVISATLAACLAFIIGRFFGHDLADKLAGSGRIGPWIEKIENRAKENGFLAFFIMRCLFLPYIITSYASGLVRSAKLLDFALATLVTNLIFSFMFVYLGDSLLKGPKALILPILLIILALQVPRILKKLGIGKGW